MVCRFNPGPYVQRVREVRGFSLATLPRVDSIRAVSLPKVVPLMFHRSGRVTRLSATAVAVPLYKLVDWRTGELNVRSKEELANRFLIGSHAHVVVSGVGRDSRVERWWGHPHRPKLIEGLKRLDVALVTSPNFSLFTDVPRWDNLHAMKRIGEMWTELVGAGLPTALHVNARTDRDYERWAEFIVERLEVGWLAFEFGTGAVWPDRVGWHVDKLLALAHVAGRPLNLVIRGGARKREQLLGGFREVVFIESESFPRTIKRRKAYVDALGNLRWHSAFTERGAVLDDLLEWNVATVRSWISTGPRVPSGAAAPWRQRPRRSTEDRDDEARQGRFL